MLGGAYSGIDFRALDGQFFEKQHRGMKILFGRSLSSSFNLVSSLSLNLRNINNSVDPVGGYEGNARLSGLILDLDLGLQYKFANGYILPEDSWFDPYIQIGGGVTTINETRGLLNAGLGMNFWLFNHEGDQIGLFVQTDYDYLPNFNDYLHHSIGIKVRFGAKDSDGDGIVDSKDKCPDVKGTKALGGCPDSDGDGIIDKEDACPQVAGLQNLNGCPDSDGDGIADKDDECPKIAGVKDLKGCPDSDGDGIADKDDACPKVAGVKALNGCPDSDGDGIADKDDACPKVAGVKALNGCPDSDGDGIADKDDKCPKVAGVKRLNGCPEKKKEEVDVIEAKLSMSAKKIQFATGSAIIKQSSYADLDKVLALMKANPNSTFNVEGHTDNVGDHEKNRVLSQKRADAVKDYFVKKGISASRISATGYGDTKPITTNSTRQGRETNRRVEIHLAK
jgi:outer membrane protein OmpA-like peptidoglycan-associated protein